MHGQEILLDTSRAKLYFRIIGGLDCDAAKYHLGYVLHMSIIDLKT